MSKITGEFVELEDFIEKAISKQPIFDGDVPSFDKFINDCIKCADILDNKGKAIPIKPQPQPPNDVNIKSAEWCATALMWGFLRVYN